MRRVKELRLDNDLKVLLVDIPGMHSSSVEVFVKIGSKYEKHGQYGLSHFLEHMAFKGTEKYPTAKLLHQQLDSKGASYNAGTDLESTSYYIKTSPDNVLWANSLLSEMLLKPIFPEKELQKEKGVVCEEIAMYEDNPMMGLSTTFGEAIVKEKRKIGCYTVLGGIADVKNITRSKLVDYRNSYLSLDRAVLVICGDLDKMPKQSNLLASLNSIWKDFPRSSTQLPKLEVSTRAPFNRTVGKNLDQVHMCIGYETIKRSSKDRYVAKMIDLMLVGSFSSYLVHLLREDLSVAYYASSISDYLQEMGYFGIQTGVAKARAEEVESIILREIAAYYKTATPKDLERAKEYLAGSTHLLMDKVTFWSNFVGEGYLLEDKVLSVEQELGECMKVSSEDIKKFAKKYFSGKKPWILKS